MLRKLLFCFVVLSISALTFGQEYRWKLGLEYFFDNGEYDDSSYLRSGTMNGIWFNPLGSVAWNEHHAIFAGVNLLKIPGMAKAVDKTDVTLYYQYKHPKILFRAGAFPRSEVLDNYNTFFFRDSVNHFMPLMQGVFWQFGSKENFFNAWMDWTGYASPDIHEHFFIGFSGKWSRKMFFADFQSYMFHHSLTDPKIEGEGVNENLQLQTMTGIHYQPNEMFDLLVAAGLLAGYERDRRFDQVLYKPFGFVSRLDMEYHGIGIKNNFYVGEPRMRLFDDFGANLYWGTLFLRGKYYLKSDWYIRLIESPNVKVRLNSNLHFSEHQVMFQQLFTVSATIGNYSERKEHKTIYPWMSIFDR